MTTKQVDVEINDNMDVDSQKSNKTTTTTTTTTKTTLDDDFVNNILLDDPLEGLENKKSNGNGVGSGGGGGDDDDDVLLQEIPVFLSQTLSNNLYLFQYPLRQPWRPYDMSKLEEFRIKPKQQKIEMDLSLDEDTFNPDSPLANNKFTLSSSTVLHRTNYCAGLMKYGELHLTPLQSVVQIRPQFDFYNQKAAEDKDKKKKDKDEEEEEQEQEKPAPVSFRKQNGRFNSNQPPNFIKMFEDNEQWIKVNYVHDKDEYNDSLFQTYQKLINTEKHDRIDFEMTEAEYFDMLCPKVSEEPGAKTNHLLDTVPLDTIHQMTWKDQIKNILINAQVVTFSKIVHLLRTKEYIEDYQIIEELENIAILIRGRWVVKSELVSKDGSIIAARDYLLLLFSKSEIVSRKELCDETNLTPEEARELFVKVSDINHKDRAWYLKKEPDEDFVSRYPLVVNKFERYFSDREQLIKKKVKDYKTPATKIVYPENYRAGKNAKEQLHYLLHNLFNKYGVCSMQLIKQHLVQELESKEANLLGNLNLDKELPTELSNIALVLHNSYVLKSSGDPNIDKYRNVVIDLFKNKLGLKKEEIQGAVKSVVGSEIPRNIFSVILSEFTTKGKNIYILKVAKK